MIDWLFSLAGHVVTVLAFLVGLGVLIVVHEYGHYRAAVACGVKVLRFSVGFGKVVCRYQKSADSTEFVLCALPLGGYVRMLDEREAPVPLDQRSSAFNNQPLWRRMAIVLAGPAANLLLAVILFATVHWIGAEEEKPVMATPAADSLAGRAGLRAGDWVREVSRHGQDWVVVKSMPDLHWQVVRAVMGAEELRLRVVDATGQGERTLTLDINRLGSREVDAAAMRRVGLWLRRDPVVAKVGKGPASEKGLQVGDRVVRLGEVSVIDADHLESMIRTLGSDGQPQPQVWQVQRGAQTLIEKITPVVDPVSGLPRVGLNFYSDPEWVTVRYGFIDGLAEAARNTWDRSRMTLQMLGQIVTGQASVKNLSGALSMADYAGRAARLGVVVYLAYLAGLSVGLGVLNLLPVPVLDGGHLMYYLFEALTGRPVPEAWLERLQRGGMIFLLLIMSLALYNDLTR